MSQGMGVDYGMIRPMLDCAWAPQECPDRTASGSRPRVDCAGRAAGGEKLWVNVEGVGLYKTGLPSLTEFQWVSLNLKVSHENKENSLKFMSFSLINNI